MNEKIDTKRRFNSKMFFLGLFLFLGLSFLIYGLSLFSEIKEKMKSISTKQYFLIKFENEYKKADKINKDSKFGKIDYFYVDDILFLIKYLKKEINKYGTIKNLNYGKINIGGNKLQTLTLNFNIIFNDENKMVSLIKKMIDYNLLMPGYSIIYKNGVFDSNIKLQLYFKGKYNKNFINKISKEKVGKKNKNNNNSNKEKKAK